MPANTDQKPWRVVVVVASLSAVVSVLLWGGLAQRNGPAQAARPVEIQGLLPNEGDLTPPQGGIQVDLRDEFTGQLSFDGTPIPADQTTGDPNLGIIEFQPGPGKQFTEWPKGAHSAVIEWWPRTIPSPEAARQKGQLRSYSWAFNVG